MVGFWFQSLFFVSDKVPPLNGDASAVLQGASLNMVQIQALVPLNSSELQIISWTAFGCS